MRKFLLLSITILCSFAVFSQDYSNKGKNFWICYPEHINSTNSVMGLYITSDVNTTGVITVNGTNIPFAVTANNVISTFLGPNGGGSAPNTFVHMGGIQDGIKIGGAIHVVSVQPVVVYAHIIFSARSGASLILPTQVWGKEYIVPSYVNSGGNGAGQGYGELDIMASFPNTLVEITPRITTRNGLRAAGVPYQITLANPGDVYQVQFPQNTDMSGTTVKSIAAGLGGCQPIAVVSATTWTALNCGSGSGGDNFYQQLFPYGSWGKSFLTTPLKKTAAANDHNVDIVRVFVKDPLTVVKKTENGVVTTLAGLAAGNFYEYSTEYATLLEADNAIEVMEYIKTQGCNAPGSPQTPSDPEMIALTAVEQTINDITVFSAFQANVPPGQSNVTTHYINVIMKTANTGSFRINGLVPTATFNVIPGTVYSYMKQNIPTSGSPVSRLKADSGFTAIAYGFGDVESYGYSAGTNVRDLTQQLELGTQYGIETSPSVCTNSPFVFKVYFPAFTTATPPVAITYDSMDWKLSNAAIIVTNNFPIRVINPTIDSTNIRNGKQVNWYSLPATYFFTTPAFDTLTITGYKSTNEGCGTDQDYIFPIEITNPPTASFSTVTPGCYLEPVVATETTPQLPKPTYKLWWEFYDPVTNLATVYTGIGNGFRTISHTFTTPGVKRIRHASITTPGCLSDTLVQNVTLPDVPNATISGTVTTCINTGTVPVTFAGTDGKAPYTFYYHINAGGAISVNSVGTTVIINAPTTVAGTFVYTLDSIRNVGSTLCVRSLSGQSATVTILPDHAITLNSANNVQAVCINTSIVNIQYTLSGGATGATITGLPAGVTYSVVGNILTITGAPTTAVSSPYNYTITTTGNACLLANATGTITVNPDHGITLNSGNNIQAVCINTNIADIQYTLSGGATGVTVTGLPPGVTFSVVGSTLTITGAPTTTVGSPYNYTITTTGNACLTAGATGKITVNPDHAITLNSANNVQAVCINTSIVNIQYTLSGGASGATITGLPTGVTYSVVGNILTITGAPTTAVSSPYNYTITTTGNACLLANATGTITVNPDHAITLNSGNNIQTVCITNNIVDIQYSLSGGATGVTVTGLPPGVTFSVVGSTLTITGAPTTIVGSPFNYSITTTGNACLTANATGKITVNPNHAITLNTANNNQAVCINTSIVDIKYTLSGGATGVTITGLPTGVTYSVVGNIVTITGTPTTSAGSPFIYSITTNGNACALANAGGVITVNPDHAITLNSGNNIQAVCINTNIVDIQYSLSGGATGVTVTGLPPGVTFSVVGSTLTITGAPTTIVGSPFNYSITTTGNACITANATGKITVNPDHAITLNTANNNQAVCINTSIVDIKYTLSGGATGVTITGLPLGITYSVVGNILTITGAPTTTAGSPFIYSITTNGNACAPANAGGVITVNPVHAISLSGGNPSPAVCVNSSIPAISYTFSGGATNATVSGLPPGVTYIVVGNVVTITGAPTTAVGSPFAYTVTTSGNACLTASAGGIITVYRLPVADFTYTIPSCDTRVITFTDASAANSGVLQTWSWNFGDPGSGVNNTSNSAGPVPHIFTSTAASPYTVTLSVTTSFGCVSNPIASKLVAIHNRPQAGFMIPEVCINDIAAFFTDTSKVAAPDGLDPAGYVWDFGDGSPRTTTQNGTHLYLATGNYNVMHIVTSFSGCRDTIIQPITINGANPVAVYTVNNPAALCANDSVAITNQSTVNFGNVTKLQIIWDFVNQPAVVITDDVPFFGKVYRHLYPNFQAPLTKNFTIRVRAFSGTLCFNDATQVITVNAAPKVQFNNMPDTCFLAAPFQITQASEIGGVPGSGVFSGPGVSPTGIFTPAVAGIGTHTIKYTFTSSAGGCVDTMSKTIKVLDTAHAKFTYVSPFCENTPASFTDVSTSPAGVVLTNTVWNFGDGSPLQNHAPGTTFTHLFPAPATYNVTMYNVSAVGCNSTPYTEPVTVAPNHTIILSSAAGTNNQTVCINQNIVQIRYTLGGGATGATVTGLPTGVTYTVAGTSLTIDGAPSTAISSPFIYNITTTGNACALANASGQIAVQSNHTISLSSPVNSDGQSVCVNSAIDPIIYTLGGGASGATITGLPPGITYTVVGNTVTISGTTVSTVGGPLFPYNVTTTGNGCVQANAAGSITVNPYPAPNFGVDKPSYCIPNALVAFNNTTTISDGSPMTYLWNFGEASSGSANTSVGVNPSHWYSGTGPFNVMLTATSTAVLSNGVIGCSHDTIIVINTIHPQPKADFTISKPAGVCINDPVTFTDNSDGKDGIINQWHWDLGDGSIRSTSAVTYTYADTITYAVSLYAVNSIGCNSDTITKAFVVHPYPHVNAGPDRFILEGGSIILESVTYGNDLQFLWTPNQFLVDNTVAQPRVYKPLNDMLYTLTVTARGGCTRSDDVFVKLLKFPTIPNTFSPNNDGINDTWKIDYLDTYPDNRVQVFTRGGQLVFESRGYTTPWDGTVKGKKLPVDTYYYIIEPGNGRDPITGYVTIIK